MNDADSFLRSLKAIGFPQVNAYKSSDFENLFLDEELKPILESICDLNEDNVLTSEELAEYAAISPDELAYFEKLAEDENLFITDESDNEKSQEVQYLEEYLELVKEEKNSLQKQKELLKSHNNLLLEEKRKHENELMYAEKQFEIYTANVPLAEAELASNLKTLVNSIVELQALIADSDGNSKVLPQSIFKDLDSYFESEEKIVNHVKSFLQKQLEVNDDAYISLKVPGYSQSKLLREVHFLRNILKSCKTEEFSAVSEKMKNEAIINFLKKYDDFSYVFNISSSLLSSKLSEETKLNNQLKEKEEFIKLRLSKAFSELVNNQCAEIGTTYSEEVIQCCNRNTEKMQVPLEHLISQRSRLELVILYLNSYKQSFESLKHLVETASSFIEKERGILCYMKDLCKERKLSRDTNQENDGVLPDSSTLMTVNKILNDSENQHLSFGSCEEVLKGIRKLFEDQARFEKLQNDKLHHLHLMEEQSVDLEKYVYKGKQFSKLLEVHTIFNITLNRVDLKTSHFMSMISEIEADINEKEKILERSGNLMLSRNLYIDAFLDPVHYEKQIQRIKAAYENKLDSSANQSLDSSKLF